MANRWVNNGNSERLYFLGLQDGDCSHEIKRHLLLGRKAMTNWDSILKSRDITSPVKVCLVKARAFSVVMYGCERWTVKKAWSFWTVVLEKTLESPLDCKEIQPVHSKGGQPWVFFGSLHSDAYIFPFVLCLSLLFFSQLFVRPPQTAILPFCISFSWGWSWSLPLYNVMNPRP